VPDPPRILAALGYEVTAFVTLEIRRAGDHDPVAEGLARDPEALGAHTITRPGDMLCQVGPVHRGPAARPRRDRRYRGRGPLRHGDLVAPRSVTGSSLWCA
jgi:hypothetical protein